MSTVSGGWSGPKITKDGLILYLDPGSPNSFYTKNTFRNAIIKDISGSGNNGSIAGPTYDSLNGGTFFFDGLDYIDCGSVFTDSGSKTLCCWTKLTSFTTGYNRHLVAKWDVSTSKRTLQLVMNSNQAYILISNNGTSFTAHSFEQFFFTNTWYYFVGVYDSVNQELKLSVNGSDFETTSYTNGMLASDSKLQVGGFDDTGDFRGNTAIVQVYNKALTQEEVLQNFNATKSRFGL